MKAPYHIEDENLRKTIDEIYAKLTQLTEQKNSTSTIVSGSTTKHKWEVKVDDTDIAAPKVQLIDLGV